MIRHYSTRVSTSAVTFPANGLFSDLSRYSEGETVKAAWMWVSFEAGLADSIQIPHVPAAFISWNFSCL